jgi:serine/threonine-protein kinase
MSDTDPEGKTISARMLPVAADLESSPTLDPTPMLLAGRYELLGMLGSGAMGTVYRACDKELDEVVALKVLKRELASADMLERFRREVKLARKVTHRNVARTYDIGEDGGDRFLTMEFIEGEMLAARLARRGRMPVNEVAQIAKDVCAGLSAAHAVGVIHRDLKPENVIIAKDGRAVITDFGIARAAQAEAASRTVGVVGTPEYMAPEQVEGASDLDIRADLYALGVMFYELIAGEPAWRGETVIAIAAARLLKPPPDVRNVVPNVSPAVAELLLRLMARRREDRPASAEDVIREIDAIIASMGSLSTHPQVPSVVPKTGTLPIGAMSALKGTRPGSRVVAVLPIVNLGTNEDNYLVNGVLEDLVDLLSMVRGLAVRPRGETMRYTDQQRDAREIGRAVNADVVVDGSFRRIGERVRASFRLIAVEDGFQLWAQRFDRPPAEVLTIADDAADAIAKALTAELGVDAKKERTHDPEAEDLYLRGRFLMRRNWSEFLFEAAQTLERAYARAPNDPRIAGAYALAVARTFGSPPVGAEAAEKARSIAEKTLESDPRQTEARVAIATLHLQNQEVDAAVRHFRQALASSPNSIEALDFIGRIMSEVGREQDAITYLRRAYAIDPENISARYQIARIYAILGDTQRMTYELGPLPSHPGDMALWFMIQARDALWRRDVANAERLLQMVNAAPSLPQSARYAMNQLFGVVLGTNPHAIDRANLDRILPVDATRTPRRASFNAQLRAEAAGALGNMGVVVESLRLADGNSLVDLVWLDHCPLWDELRSGTNYQKLRERVAVRAKRVCDTLDVRSPTLG